MAVKHVIWYVSMNCNYHCPYCVNWQQPKSEGYYEHTADEWTRFFREDANFSDAFLDITGGEPLAYPGIEDMLRSIPNRFALTSNLSWPIEDIQRLAALPNFVGVTCSYHPTQASFEDFFAKVEALRGLVASVSVNLVAFKTNLKDIERSKEKCERLQIFFNLDPYRGNLWIPTDKQQQQIDQHCKPNRSAVVTGAPDKICDAGSAFVTIRPDGNIYRCTLKSFINPDCLGNCFTGYRLYDGKTYCGVHCSAGCDIDHTSREVCSPTIVGKVNVDAFFETRLASCNQAYLRWQNNDEPWDHMKARYSEAWARRRFVHLLEYLHDIDRHLAGKEILDFACGHSPWYSEAIWDMASVRPKHITAADIVQRDIDGDSISTRYVDWDKIGDFHGEWDTILFTEGLEHVRDYKRVVCHLLDRCREVAVFTFPISEQPGQADPGHVNFFRPDDIYRIFDGDKIWRIDIIDGTAYVTVDGRRKHHPYIRHTNKDT